MKTRLPLCLILFACAAASMVTPASADPPTCRGEVATLTPADAANGVITGTEGPDVIVGSDGADTINAGDGDDLICAGGGVDTVNGGGGNDQLYLEDGGSLFVDGEPFYGRACGTGALADDATEVGTGGPGADLVDGGQGADCVRGGGGNDALLGSDGSDDVRGDAGADFVSGDDGNDYARDGYGSDDMSGGTGSSDVWQRCDDGVPDNQDGTFQTVTAPDAAFC